MKLEDRLRQERDRSIAAGSPPVAATLQGVDKARVRAVLRRLDLDQPDIVDAVFALLDDTRESWFSGAPSGSTVADGASTAHVGCHVGILQRDGTKLDREGRDYWLKPLRDIGAIEAIQLHKGVFVAGHPVPKHPMSAYRLNAAFKAILQAPEDQWGTSLGEWSAEDVTRVRLQLQAELAEAARASVDTGHADLIGTCREVYAPRFLPGFVVVYEDSADGERVDEDDRAELERAGLTLALGDAMPDLLLWNRERGELWIIEAVTSDGEVDGHKVRQVREWAGRQGKACVGFTTAYRTWKEAAARQGKMKNIAPGTFVWIAEDGSKHWLAEAFDARE